MKTLSQIASLVLTPLLAASPMWSQAPIAASSAEIQLHVLGNDGKEAAAGSRSTKGFTVQVTDETGAGIPDAAVVLRLPEEEPTGYFADGTHSAVAYTAQNGQVEISGIKWGSMPGAVTIKVTATKGDAHAGMLIDEKLNSATPVPASPAEVKPEPKPEKLPTELPAVPTRSSQSPVTQAPVERAHVTVRQPAVSDADRRSAARSTIARADSKEPTVSVINGKTHEKLSSGGHKKWIILLAVVAAGAGAGVALGSKSKASATTSAPSTVSVGPPSVSIGKP